MRRERPENTQSLSLITGLRWDDEGKTLSTLRVESLKRISLAPRTH